MPFKWAAQTFFHKVPVNFIWQVFVSWILKLRRNDSILCPISSVIQVIKRLICLFCILSWLFWGGGCRQRITTNTCALKRLVSEWPRRHLDNKLSQNGRLWYSSKPRFTRMARKECQNWKAVGRRREFLRISQEGFIWAGPERACMFWELKYSTWKPAGRRKESKMAN